MSSNTDPTRCPSDPVSHHRLHRTLSRRETHRPRSGSATTVVLVLAVGAAWVGTEAVLSAVGLTPLLVDPAAAVRAVASVTALAPAALVVGSVVGALLGLLLVVLAVAPGHRRRHTIDDERMAVVVDDSVIASRIARTARTAARAVPERARASVSLNRAVIDLTPRSGVGVNLPLIESAVVAEIDDIAPRPRPNLLVTIQPTGRIRS